MQRKYMVYYQILFFSFLFFPLSLYVFSDQVLTEKGLHISVKMQPRDQEEFISFEVKVENLTNQPKSLSGTIVVYKKESKQKIGEGIVFVGVKPKKTVTKISYAFLDQVVSAGNWEFIVDVVYDFILEDDTSSDTTSMEDTSSDDIPYNNDEEYEDDTADDINTTSTVEPEVTEENNDSDLPGEDISGIPSFSEKELTDNYFFIMAKHSAYCIEVGWASMDDGAHVFHQAYYEGPNERWTFVPPQPEVSVMPGHRCIVSASSNIENHFHYLFPLNVLKYLQ
ncbi:MAG: hypothetical protein JXB88_14195 [Spirochaetales bacterium]|nr:hypothetical protein [Spirochaetales bacterium]